MILGGLQHPSVPVMDDLLLGKIPLLTLFQLLQKINGHLKQVQNRSAEIVSLFGLDKTLRSRVCTGVLFLGVPRGPCSWKTMEHLFQLIFDSMDA